MKTLHFFAEVNQTQGILLRAGLVLERRGFVLESLETVDYKGRVFLNIRVKGPEEKKDQAIKQLAKLIDVYSVQEISDVEWNVNPTFEKEYQMVLASV